MDAKQEQTLSLDDDIAEDAKLNLLSRENESYSVLRKVAMMSELVKTMAEGDSSEENIPLPNVKSSILTKVIEYMTYHHANPAKEIEKPLKSSIMSEVVSKWDASFVDVDQEVLFELILAANYMDIKPLLDLTCAKVASMIKGKTPEQIRKTFNIKNDFLPQEEEAVRAENKWAEEA
jgi:S-phase kinase-associated protein 1